MLSLLFGSELWIIRFENITCINSRKKDLRCINDSQEMQLYLSPQRLSSVLSYDFLKIRILKFTCCVNFTGLYKAILTQVNRCTFGYIQSHTTIYLSLVMLAHFVSLEILFFPFTCYAMNKYRILCIFMKFRLLSMRKNM